MSLWRRCFLGLDISFISSFLLRGPLLLESNCLCFPVCRRLASAPSLLTVRTSVASSPLSFCGISNPKGSLIANIVVVVILLFLYSLAVIVVVIVVVVIDLLLAASGGFLVVIKFVVLLVVLIAGHFVSSRQ